MKKGQVFIGIGVIAAIIVFAATKYADNSKLTLFLITGLMLGYTLQRSRFGFAGGVRRIAMTGDGTLSKALLFLFSLSTIGAAGIHYAGTQSGAEVTFRAAKGAATIAGTGHVSAISLGFIIGGLLFGVGMLLGGGCASGTLTDTGEGSVRGLIVLLFFCIGGMLGTLHLPTLKKTFLYTSSVTVYLPDTFGYIGAVVVSLLGFLGLYFVVKAYESKRRKAGTFNKIEYDDWEKEVAVDRDYGVFNNQTYHKLFIERWSSYTGAAIIAMLFIFILTTTNSSWGASGPYTHWGVWLFSKFGINFGEIEAFKSSAGVVYNGILNDPISVRNIGMILGAAICMLLAGKWKLSINFKSKDIIFYALAGILMGYGAKLAGGCNVGALFSGIANLSLSGWVFMATLIAGGMLGVRIVKKFDIPA